MQNQKLVLFDFDGVIVDGMQEYWFSSSLACREYLISKELPLTLKNNLPVSNTFRYIRPWVKYGWEMVLITHEILKKNNPLDEFNKNLFVNNYHQNCLNILTRNSWNHQTVQKSLDDARKHQMDLNFDNWMNLHLPFNKVISFIKKANDNGLKIGIISTKGRIFTQKILHKLDIFPELIFGYECGTKLEIITNLSCSYRIIGFIEDRRKTLMNIINNDKTRHIPCFLANWGYLKESDKLNLPKELKVLKLNDLEDILAVSK